MTFAAGTVAEQLNSPPVSLLELAEDAPEKSHAALRGFFAAQILFIPRKRGHEGARPLVDHDFAAGRHLHDDFVIACLLEAHFCEECSRVHIQPILDKAFSSRSNDDTARRAASG